MINGKSFEVKLMFEYLSSQLVLGKKAHNIFDVLIPTFSIVPNQNGYEICVSTVRKFDVQFVPTFITYDLHLGSFFPTFLQSDIVANVVMCNIIGK